MASPKNDQPVAAATTPATTPATPASLGPPLEFLPSSLEPQELQAKTAGGNRWGTMGLEDGWMGRDGDDYTTKLS